MYLDRRMNKSVEKEAAEFIHEVGREIYIQYYVKTDCPYDSVDKSYKSGNNPRCSTCNGTGYIKKYEPKIVKAIINSFFYSRFDRDVVQKSYDAVPYDSIRITTYLKDVVVNVNSAESKSLFDSCDYVRVNSVRYSVTNTKRLGMGENFLCQVLLNEIR